MKQIAIILLCCGILLGFTGLSPAKPKEKELSQNQSKAKAQPKGKKDKAQPKDKNSDKAHSADSGRSTEPANTLKSGEDASAEGTAYFYASNAFRLRKIYPDGTVLLVSEVKAYDWKLKQYYDVLEKVELIGLRLPNSQDACRQEYLERLEQLADATLLYVEGDRSVQASDSTLQPAYLWTKEGLSINLQLVREGYAAAWPWIAIHIRLIFWRN